MKGVINSYELVKELYKNDYGDPFELTPGQVEIFDTIFKRKHPRNHIMTCSQYGKEIADHIPVLTSNGWKRHGDLAVNDYVFNNQGDAVRIKAVMPKGMDDVEVEFSSGEKIICNENHEWIVRHQNWRRRNKGYKCLEIKELLKYKLKSSSCSNFMVPNIKALQFPEKVDLLIDPYTLGVWLGDGTTTKPSITIHPNDEDIIKKIPYKFSCKYIHKTTGIATYDFWGTEFYQGLKEMGLIFRSGNSERKGMGKKLIPEIYKKSSLKQRLELLAGLIDTDGSVCAQRRKDGRLNGRIYFVNTNKRLIDDVVDLIRILGMRPSVVKVKAQTSSSGIKGKKDVFYVGFNSTMGIPTVLERKKIIPRQQRHVSIKNIHRVKPVRGNCISLDRKDGIYLVGKTLIPTHNSNVVAMAALTRASTFPEKWPIVAPTMRKAKIIMGYIAKHIFENPYTLGKFQIGEGESLEHFRRERSKSRVTFRTSNNQLGEIFVLSAESRRKGVEAGDALMGFGAQNLIEDESALIPDRIHSKAMRMLGGHKDNFLVKIGNPFRRNHFLKSYRSDDYHKIVIDFEQAIAEGRMTPEFIEEMRNEAFFDILYGCKFPEIGSMDDAGWTVLLTDQEIEKAMEREVEPNGPKKLGVDVARGGNYSVWVVRQGMRAFVRDKNRDPDLMSVVGKTKSIMKEEGINASEVNIDDVGIGGGITDRLKEQNIKVNGVKVGNTARDHKKFVNVRAEVYWEIHKWVKAGGSLEKNDDWYQLCDIKYKEDSSSKLKIMSKDEMRASGIESPDVADALSLTFAGRKTGMGAAPTVSTRGATKGAPVKRKEDVVKPNAIGGYRGDPGRGY